MEAIKHFRAQWEQMKGKAKPDQVVRVMICGIDASWFHAILDAQQMPHTIIIQGLDEAGIETTHIAPVGHFSARLSYVPRDAGSKRIGFQMS